MSKYLLKRMFKLELSLIGHFAYLYIGRKYRDLSICIDLFIIFEKMFKKQILYFFIIVLCSFCI